MTASRVARLTLAAAAAALAASPAHAQAVGGDLGSFVRGSAGCACRGTGPGILPGSGRPTRRAGSRTEPSSSRARSAPAAARPAAGGRRRRRASGVRPGRPPPAGPGRPRPPPALPATSRTRRSGPRPGRRPAPRGAAAPRRHRARPHLPPEAGHQGRNDRNGAEPAVGRARAWRAPWAGPIPSSGIAAPRPSSPSGGGVAGAPPLLEGVGRDLEARPQGKTFPSNLDLPIGRIRPAHVLALRRGPGRTPDGAQGR